MCDHFTAIPEITLRDYFAAAIISGLAAGNALDLYDGRTEMYNTNACCSRAYQVADMMIEQKWKKKNG